MDKDLKNALTKMYENRFINSEEAFSEFVSNLDFVSIYLTQQREILDLSQYVRNVSIIFDDNIEFDCIASVEDLLFDLVRYKYLHTIDLFNEMLNLTLHYNTIADSWGDEIFKSIFYILEKGEEMKVTQISIILKNKENNIVINFKDLINKMDFEFSPIEIKIFANKCLSALDTILL